MLNSKKEREMPAMYKSMYEDDHPQQSGNFVGAIVIICLFSLLAGLLGFWLGDTGTLRNLNLQGLTNVNNTGIEADKYTQDEINRKINASAYDFELYNQIIANLKDKFVDTEKVKDDSKFFNGSLKGLVDSVGDFATSYFSPEEYKEYKASFAGEFEGIGVRLEYVNGSVSIVDVIPGSPALEAGVKNGYIVYKVNDEDVSKLSMDEVVAKVKGAAGTKVKIVFIDPEQKSQVEKEITRAAIKIDSMRLIEKNKDTVVFEISRFTEPSVAEWNAKWDKNVNEIVNKGYKNVILDLRGNGGGYLDSAIYAANDFLDPGKLVVSEKSRVRGDKDTKSLRESPRLKGKNVVILINNGTASASEILSGAIQFHNKYQVIGTKSFGKGTVQNPYELPNGGMLKITTEYWLLPTGKKIDPENPILPSKEVKQDQDKLRSGVDNVLDEAMKSF